ncbi:MAG: hypothetical protein KatS3mg111_4237 [Pirellulaceae bacterium]|nr:MAG: hypothetical protein KatS3mg111_4237 [Pirellulaceae bacterium]
MRSLRCLSGWLVQHSGHCIEKRVSMRRENHDLPGCMQRLARLGEALHAEFTEAQELWKDDVGRQFCTQYLQILTPAFNSLVTGLAEQIELAERMMEQLKETQAQ